MGGASRGGPGNRQGLAVVIGLVLVFAGCVFLSGERDQPPTPPGPVGGIGTTPSATGPALPTQAPNQPSWTGELRMAEAYDFTSGVPEPRTDGYYGTLSYTDYQDRLGYGGRGSRLIAPWPASTTPTYEECLGAIQTNSYGRSEGLNMPKTPGAGYCLNDSDEVVVFFRIVDHEVKRAVRIDTTIWPYLAG